MDSSFHPGTIIKNNTTLKRKTGPKSRPLIKSKMNKYTAKRNRQHLVARTLKNHYGESNTNLPGDKRKTKKETEQEKSIKFREKHSDILTKSNPNWYLIPEIKYVDFLFCLQQMFNTIELIEDKEDKINDIFLQAIYFAKTSNKNDPVKVNTDDINKYNIYKKTINTYMGLKNNLGTFHENLASKFPGFEILQTGHWSEMDIRSTDKKIYFEFKNSSSISSKFKVFTAIEKLLKSKQAEKCVIVCINTSNNSTETPNINLSMMEKGKIVDLTPYKDQIKIINGREAYALFSGSPDFFDRLVKTMYSAFRNNDILAMIKDL